MEFLSRRNKVFLSFISAGNLMLYKNGGMSDGENGKSWLFLGILIRGNLMSQPIGFFNAASRLELMTDVVILMMRSLISQPQQLSYTFESIRSHWIPFCISSRQKVTFPPAFPDRASDISLPLPRYSTNYEASRKGNDKNYM
jgi:hypothetical protein